MRLGAGVVVIVVCAAVLLGYACAQADDAALSYSSGMVSVLDEHATVRMATCQIAADIYERQSKVRCQFEFLNEGPPTMVTMGFPAFAGSEGGEKLSPDLRDFRTWVGGKRVPTEIVEETDNSKHGPDRWYVKHVYFERGMRRSVRNTYIQPHGDSTSGVHWFPYKLTTGSSWHGPIGRLSVTLRWQEPWEWVPHVQESNWRWRRSDDGHALSWNGENVEPATNVHLDFELGWRDLFCDGFRIEPFPVGHFRVSGDRLEMPVEPLARILRAGVKFDNQAKAVRLIRGDQRIVLTLGRSGRSCLCLGRCSWGGIIRGQTRTSSGAISATVSRWTGTSVPSVCSPASQSSGRRRYRGTASRRPRRTGSRRYTSHQ